MNQLDITAPKAVEVKIRSDGKVVWVNVDGVCAFRACRIERLTVEDDRLAVVDNGNAFPVCAEHAQKQLAELEAWAKENVLVAEGDDGSRDARS